LRAPYTRCALVAATIWSLRTILWINLFCLFWTLAGVSRQGGSLFWEIEQCLRCMPAKRIILIAELGHCATSNYELLCNKFPELWNVPSPIPIYPSRFVIPLRFWKWWFFQYERRMHHCMKAIAAQESDAQDLRWAKDPTSTC
jgi:hypothetical protein